jgi:hypothetical protein
MPVPLARTRAADSRCSTISRPNIRRARCKSPQNGAESNKPDGTAVVSRNGKGAPWARGTDWQSVLLVASRTGNRGPDFRDRHPGPLGSPNPRHRDQTAAEIIEAVHQAACQYLGTEKPTDDITVVVVKVLTRASESSLASEADDGREANPPVPQDSRGQSTLIERSTGWQMPFLRLGFEDGRPSWPGWSETVQPASGVPRAVVTGRLARGLPSARQL